LPVVKYATKAKPVGTLVLKRPITAPSLRAVRVIVNVGKSDIQVVVIPSKFEDTNDDAREFT
jgi:hypothetical protein|tara:strand:+ start:699 stop:884 length:186 start_codon:yes stop_codon:yes gene_type:complete